MLTLREYGVNHQATIRMTLRATSGSEAQYEARISSMKRKHERERTQLLSIIQKEKQQRKAHAQEIRKLKSSMSCVQRMKINAAKLLVLSICITDYAGGKREGCN